MNQDNKYGIPFQEDPNAQPIPLNDISDDIAADVEAIMQDMDDPNVEIGVGFDAILAEAGDPSLEIGADVEAIMAESGQTEPEPEPVWDMDPAADVDPTVAIGAEVAAFIAQERPDAALEESFPEDEPPIVEDFAPDVIPYAPETTPESIAATGFFHMPTAEELLPADEAPVYDIAEVPAAPAVPGAADISESSGFFHAPTTDDLVSDVQQEALDATAEPVEAADILPEASPLEVTDSESVPEVLPEAATQRIDREDPLYHDLLADPVVGAEIGVDEHAISAAGLIHPADAELEQIIAETKAEDVPAAPQDGIIQPEPAVSAIDDTIASIDIGDMLIQDYEDPSTPAQKPEPKEEPEKPLPKRRPKMKKGYGFFGLPHVASTLVWLAITVAIGVSLGRMIWVCAAEVLAFGKPDQEYTVTITAADNIDTVAAKLKNAGLIKYPELFKLYAGITNAEEELSAGTFVLNSKYDYNALVNAMTFHSSARETVKVLIPEGYTCAQIFALLEKEGVCSAAELEEYAAHGEIKDRWFLEGIQRGDKYCLEGYLFPDSYEFYTNDEPGRVLGKFLDNFDNRFTNIMKEKIDPLNERMGKVLADRGYTQDYIDAHKFTIREIVIIASMIERETANDSESYDIASVIYNRLTNPSEFLYLNIDATIIYALGGNIDPVTGKTKPLTKEDLQLDSPYNTYTRPGLIPGPISNPGRNSLNAALDPNFTDYYFYVYNPNISKHLFAKTAAEHDKNVAYVRSLEEDS